jgi:hypothetical protein
MSGFGSLKPWEGGAQAELKKKAARLAGVGWRSLAAIDAGLVASDAGLGASGDRGGSKVQPTERRGRTLGGHRTGVPAVTVSVIAHGPDNAMILLGCVGVSPVKQ